MVENKLGERIKLRKSGGIKTLSETASENNIHPNLLSKWKRTAISGLPQLFKDESIF